MSVHASRERRLSRTDRHDARRAFTKGLLIAARQWRRIADGVLQDEQPALSEATALPLIVIESMATPPTQTALAEAVGVEGPSLVRVLDQLCAARLVTRSEDPNDRRAKVITLTPAGRRTVAKIQAGLDRMRDEIFGDLSLDDIEAALRSFQALRRHLDKATAAARETESV